MTHASPTPETDDAAIPETSQITWKQIPKHEFPPYSSLSHARLPDEVWLYMWYPPRQNLDPWAELLHYYPVMTITKSAHIRTAMWLELQLKSAVLAEWPVNTPIWVQYSSNVHNWLPPRRKINNNSIWIKVRELADVKVKGFPSTTS